MTTEEIIYELKTLSDYGAGCETNDKEVEAMRAAIPILNRCEKYRKALEAIAGFSYNDEPCCVGLANQALDCEEN